MGRWRRGSFAVPELPGFRRDRSGGIGMSNHNDPMRSGRWNAKDVLADLRRDRRMRRVWLAAVLLVMLGLVAVLVWAVA